MATEMTALIRQQSLQVLEAIANGHSRDEVAQVQKQLLGNIVQLRAANRALWQDSRAAKAATAEMKAGIDQHNLELQGLYYEQRHIKNEIKSCQETPTIFDQIDLIDEADFLEQFPDCKELNNRDLMHARLEHEKSERLRLEGLRKELVAKKSSLVLENKRRKTELENLEKQLTTFMSSAENISSIFQKH